MAISKTSGATSTPTIKKTSAPPPPPKKTTTGTSSTNQFVKAKAPQQATTPAKKGISRDLSARATRAPQTAQTAQAAQTSSLPFKPNPTTLANAEKTGLGKKAATEIPKNAQYYNKASELTGVPSSMIAAIHGNESQFGTYKKSTNGPESGYGLDPRWVKDGWANKQLAKHGLGTWERGTNSDRSKLQSAVIAAEHFKRNAGYAGIEVGPNMSKNEIAGAVTSYIQGHGAGKKAAKTGDSWMFRPNDTNPHPQHPGGTSIGPGGKKIRVAPSRKDGLLRWDTLLPMAEKHLGGAKGPQAAQGPATQAPQGQAPQIQAPGNAPTQQLGQQQQTPGQLNLPGGQPQVQAQTNTQGLPPGLAQLQNIANGNAPQVQAQNNVQAPTQVQAPPSQPQTVPNPAFQGVNTNQDAINHFYREGGGNWAGAQRIAQSQGFDLNNLVKDRQGSFSGATMPAPTQAAPNPAAPSQAAPNPAAPTQAAPNPAAPTQAAPNPAAPNPAAPAQQPQTAEPPAAATPAAPAAPGNFATEAGRVNAPFAETREGRQAQAEEILRANGQWPPQEGRAYAIQIDQDNPPPSASRDDRNSYLRSYTGQTSVFRVENGRLVEQNAAPLRSASHPGQFRSGASPDVTGDGRGDVAHIRPGVYNYTTRAHRSKGRMRYNPIDNGEFRNSGRDLNGDGVIGGNETGRNFAATAIQWHSGNANSPSSIGCQTMPPNDFSAFRDALRGANTGGNGQFTYILVRRPNDQHGANPF